MKFSSWIPDYIYTVELDDYELIPNDESFDVIMINEVIASMTANAAIFKMMRGESK